MSLIQQALEKTNRLQETRTANSASDSKVYNRDPMGAALEQELIRVQQSHAKKRRRFFWIFLGASLVCFLAGFSYVGIQKISSTVKSAPITVAALVPPQMSFNIPSGNIYRLTGITSINGKVMAVINKEIVSVGDSLPDKAVVKAIGNGEVRLDVQGREVKLTL